MDRQLIFGLQNLRNTCFMNASIQSLLAFHDLIDEINTRDTRGDINLRVMRVIFSERGLPKQSQEVCELLMHMFARDSFSYVVGQQADASEFIVFLLDKINATRQKIRIEITRKFLYEGEDIVSYENEDMLIVNIVDDNGNKLSTFDECFRNYSTDFIRDEPEEKEEDKEGYIRRTHSDREYKIEKTGKHFYIQLKRFMRTARGTNRKLKHEVEMPQTIMLPIGDEIVECNMVSMIQHDGDVGRGHYYTFRKIDDSWFLFNDEHVRKVEMTDDDFNSGFMYVYERV